MKINWKIRVKNPVFWATLIPATATFIYTVLALLGIAPTIDEHTLTNGLLAVVTGLSTVGVLVDPTTKGINDSERAMNYEDLG